MSTINPDQALIHRFLVRADTPLAVDSNPLAIALATTLVHVDPLVGRVELAFEPASLFIQGAGVLQGGAVTAMLDFAMAFATLAHLPVGHSCSTINLNTVFLRSAPQGQYVAHGYVERRGKSLAFTGARLEHAKNGRLVATASSTLALIVPVGMAR